MGKFEKYYRAVEYIENLPSIHNGCFLPSKKSNPLHYLKRTRWILEQVGNPDRDIKFVHVTGTSGKGSVAKFLAEMISASGKKTGLFTSPFCTTSIEKISIDGKYISPQEFAEEVEKLKPIIKKAEKECPWGIPTYFEIFLVIALSYFKKNGCGWVVLEVGCGGRYDASNVIEKKEIAVITNIGLDHTHIIGDTLEKVAYEKAGIIKKGCKFFTNEKRENLLQIFLDECNKNEVEMLEVQDFFQLVKYDKNKMYLKGEGEDSEIACNLWGDHQIGNINLAFSVMKEIGISNQHIVRGIQNSNLPCRFEVMQDSPKVILDGAHNPAKMKTTISNLKKMKYEKLILILGAGRKKEVDEMISLIVPKADEIILTTFDFGHPLKPQELVSKLEKKPHSQIKKYLEEDMSKALEKAFGLAGKDDLILATGSFYLSGELRKKWISEDFVLGNRSSF